MKIKVSVEKRVSDYTGDKEVTLEVLAQACQKMEEEGAKPLKVITRNDGYEDDDWSIFLVGERDESEAERVEREIRQQRHLEAQNDAERREFERLKKKFEGK